MDMATLLPHLAEVRIEQIEVLADEVVVHAVTRTSVSACPRCQMPSYRLHGSYARHFSDVPIGRRRVSIWLAVRRFRCQDPTCRQQTFAEQTPALVARYARRSVPLQALLGDLALTLGGRPSARFAGRHAIAVSHIAPLRLVRALPEPTVTTPTILGVDDFALRRGHRYGTILTDLERHQVIDLLPDRTADTFAAWLRAHGSPAIICRDRGGDYASGARLGAPDAIQIADRFHLQKNSSDVLERILARHPAALRAAVTDAATEATTDGAPSSAATAVPATAEPRRARRLARYEQVIALRQDGWSLTAIGMLVGLSRPTVRKYVNAGSFPEWPARRTKLSAGMAHASYVQTRWQAGSRDATVLWEELLERGFTGSLRMVQRAVADWRVEPPRTGWLTRRPAPPPQPAPPRPRPPSARQAVWLLLRPVEDLEPDQQVMRIRLLAAAPAIQDALVVIAAFRGMVHDRDAGALDGWLQTASASAVPELRTFAAGIRRDRPAIEAALAYAWSSGQVEGQVCRTKLIKRQMYGRAKFDLLRKRVLLAS
jgi:transposase